MGEIRCSKEGKQLFMHSEAASSIWKLPGSQRNDPGSPVPQAGRSGVLQHRGHTSLLSQQRDLRSTRRAVMCRPAERTQTLFNEASLITLLWGALCKESSCCSPMRRRQLAQGGTGLVASPAGGGIWLSWVLPNPLSVADPEAWVFWRWL